MKQCLHNDPNLRPRSEELLTRLQGVRMEVEGEYGGPVKLDMVRVRLAKEVKEKDRKIQQLMQQQVRYLSPFNPKFLMSKCSSFKIVLNAIYYKV